MRLLYGSKYAEITDLIVLVAFAPALLAVGNVLGMVLTAYERPDLSFKISIVASPLILVTSLPLVYFYGLRGAALAALTQQLLRAVCAAIIVRKEVLRRKDEIT